jgi:TatD DNase family protein
MTSTQASKARLDKLPVTLRDLYLPQATRPEKFEHGKPVKGRNEPTSVGAVAWVIHQLHPSIAFEVLVETVWKNTVDLFKLQELIE